jgi:hypothetical protein
VIETARRLRQKIRGAPRSKKRGRAKNKSTLAEDVSKAEGGEMGAAIPSNYKPGRRPETGHRGLQGNCNAIFAKKNAGKKNGNSRDGTRKKARKKHPGPSSFG